LMAAVLPRRDRHFDAILAERLACPRDAVRLRSRRARRLPPHRNPELDGQASAPRHAIRPHVH